jgi:hypothetical protein
MGVVQGMRPFGYTNQFFVFRKISCAGRKKQAILNMTFLKNAGLKRAISPVGKKS